MTHFSRLNTVVVDVPAQAHDAEVAFWAGAAGTRLRQIEQHPEYHGGMIAGTDLRLLTQRLEDGAARVHLDIHTDDLAAEVTRLEALGARRVREVNGWWIMTDPAGLPFCVIPDPPGTLTEDNAQRWD